MATPWADSKPNWWDRTQGEAVRLFHRARRDWRWGGFFAWFGIAFGAGLALLIFLLLTLDWDTMRGPVSRFVSARMGREVHINGHLRVHLFSWQPWLTAEKITVGNPKWLPNSQMGSADKLTIKVRLLPLVFEQRAIFPLISVDKPDVALIRDRAGHANWSFSDPETTNPGAMSLPPIEQFIINDGHVTMQDDKAKMSFDGTFSSHEATGGQTKNNIFVLDGKGRLRGAPLTASVRGGPLIHVDPNKPYALNVDVHHGGTHIVATGSLERPFDLNRMTAAARLSGPSLADLYFLTGLAMPNTAPYQLRTIFTRDGKFYRLAKLHGTVGKSDLFGEMSVDTGSGRPFLKASLESKSLAFSDLGPMIGSTPNGATVRVKATGGETKTVVSNTRVLPDMPLRVERVRGMDAIVDYKADTIRSQDFPLRQLLLHLTLDHGVMRMDPLAFTFPQGKLTSHIKIDARKDIPVNDVDARITDIQLAQFFGGKSAVLGGTMEARAKLHAAGDSIHKAAAAANGTVTAVIPNGTVRKAYAELSGIDITPGLFELLGNDKSDTNLRCAVAHFEARNGSLVSEQLIADTDAVQIRGHGTVNLDTERMQFAMQGHPKSFKLIRVRAPITVGGTLGDPSVGIQAGSAVAQGGIAAALGVLLTPIAAILPFVDPGLGKDANCAALLTDAKAQGAPVKTKAIRNAAPVRK